MYPPYPRRDALELAPQPLATGLDLRDSVPLTRPTPVEGEPQEVKRGALLATSVHRSGKAHPPSLRFVRLALVDTSTVADQGPDEYAQRRAHAGSR